MAPNIEHMHNDHIEKARMLGALLPTIFASMIKRTGACPHCTFQFAMGSLLGTYAYQIKSNVGDEITDGTMDMVVKIASLFHASLITTEGHVTCSVPEDLREVAEDFRDMPEDIQKLIDDVMREVLGDAVSD